MIAIAGVFPFLFFLVLWACGGWLFALAWNFVVPLFWAAAPHLTWLHGVAIGIVLSVLRTVFGRK